MNSAEYDKFFIQEFLSSMKKEDVDYYIERLEVIPQNISPKKVFEKAREDLKLVKDKSKA